MSKPRSLEIEKKREEEVVMQSIQQMFLMKVTYFFRQMLIVDVTYILEAGLRAY